MFANPLWSILLLAIPVAIWFLIIKPKLGTKLTDIYKDAGSLWERIKARFYAFRTFWVGVIGTIFTALPDLLVLVSPLDFSGILPQPWPAYTGAITSAAIVLMKAFETKPGETK